MPLKDRLELFRGQRFGKHRIHPARLPIIDPKFGTVSKPVDGRPTAYPLVTLELNLQSPERKDELHAGVSAQIAVH